MERYGITELDIKGEHVNIVGITTNTSSNELATEDIGF